MAPDICHKTKSVFKKLLQLAQTVYYIREYEEENRRQKKQPDKRLKPSMAVRLALKQPVEKCPEEPGVKGLVVTMKRRGI